MTQLYVIKDISGGITESFSIEIIPNLVTSTIPGLHDSNVISSSQRVQSAAPTNGGLKFDAIVWSPSEASSPWKVCLAKEATTTLMLEALLPKYSGKISLQKEVPNIETRHAKNDAKPKYCNRAPPAILEARDNNFSILAGKTVWILHPLHVNIPIGAGKSSIS